MAAGKEDHCTHYGDVAYIKPFIQTSVCSSCILAFISAEPVAETGADLASPEPPRVCCGTALLAGGFLCVGFDLGAVENKYKTLYGFLKTPLNFSKNFQLSVWY